MRKIRYFLAIGLIIVAVIVIYPEFKEVWRDVPRLFGEANKLFLLFLFLFQGVGYLGNGWLCRALLDVAGFKISFKNTLRVAVLGVIGNHVAPLVGGTIVAWRAYKKLGVPSAIISFLVFSWTIFVWLVYFLFLLAGFLFLPERLLNAGFLKNIFLILILLVLASAVIFLFLRKKYGRSPRFFYIILKPVFNFAVKIINLFRLKKIFAQKKFEKFISEFSQCFDFLGQNKRKIPKLLLSSFLLCLGDVLTLYFSFLVFGFRPNPALLIFGYVLSLALTVFTLMPGAPGITEASLTAVFIKLGLPAHIVLFSVILYRIFSYWLLLPFGAYFYFSLKKKNDTYLEENKMG